MFKSLLVLVCLLTASLVSAQPVVVTPTSTVSFAPSPDHDVVVGGIAVLSSYEVIIRQQGNGAEVFRRDAGKPPNAATITVPIGWTLAQFNTIPNGQYVAVIAAKGPGAPTGVESVPSDPFVILVAPRPPGKPTVVR